MYLKAKKGNINLEEHSDIISRIDKLFQDEKSWRNAYQIEQLMVGIFDDETLEVELNRRLVDAKSILGEEITQYYNAASQTPEESEKRALLDRLINDLQWKYELRQLERSYRRLIRIRTSAIFVVAVVLFILPLILLQIQIGLETTLMIPAITSGCFGAAFSMLIGLRERIQFSALEELRVQFRYDFLLSRVVIGMGAAIVLYFFLQAELLSGSMFPDLSNISSFSNADATLADINHPLGLDPRNTALLVIWCFIAGFSEKFVPNLLIKAEERVDIKS
jgi:hypothetical protein